ncbi:uncharacterized protein [Palaemon carinicauda]|uniref:uncharacterized protein isoform X2 n=1 Tax=Palaemon carinicauda TaxID=392227 RepID=UPI0035B5CD1F
MRISSLLIGLASAFLVNGTKEMKMLNLSEDQNSSSSSSFDLRFCILFCCQKDISNYIELSLEVHKRCDEPKNAFPYMLS